MRDPESLFEQRLRIALRDEAAGAGPTVSAARLHAAALARRRRQRQWWTAAAAAVGIVAVAGAVTLGSLVPRDGVGKPTPSDIAGSPSVPPTLGPTSEPATSPPTEVSVAWPTDVPLRCGAEGPTFESSVLAAATGGEHDRHPSAAALRSVLGTTVSGEEVPDAGYVLVAGDATIALYLTRLPTGYLSVWVRPIGEDGAATWFVERADVCQPELAVGAARGAEWELDPAAGRPTAASTTISLLVTERACASGRAPGDRLGEPIVRYGDGWLGIGFAIVPLEGGQDCPGNPSVPVTVTLEQPLDDRVLLDLGQFPFAEVPEPAGS